MLPDMFVQSEIVHCIMEGRGRPALYLLDGESEHVEPRPGLEKGTLHSASARVCDSPITIMLIFISQAHYPTEGNTEELFGKTDFKASFASCPYREGTVPALQQEMSLISTQACQETFS